MDDEAGRFAAQQAFEIAEEFLGVGVTRRGGLGHRLTTTWAMAALRSGLKSSGDGAACVRACR